MQPCPTIAVFVSSMKGMVVQAKMVLADMHESISLHQKVLMSEPFYVSYQC